MIKGGKGGNTTSTGLKFENKVDLITLLKKQKGYSVEPQAVGSDVFFNGKKVARCFKKYAFYDFLTAEGVDWKALLSKRLVPDDALLVLVRETLFIIEVKYQQSTGLVDEKLQTCDFKRKQYLKMVHALGIKVEYVYVLNDWFKQPCYHDVLEYIHSVNCHYKFNELPLSWLGLPK